MKPRISIIIKSAIDGFLSMIICMMICAGVVSTTKNGAMTDIIQYWPIGVIIGVIVFVVDLIFKLKKSKKLLL